jgi:hypothetical protein
LENLGNTISSSYPGQEVFNHAKQPIKNLTDQSLLDFSRKCSYFTIFTQLAISPVRRVAQYSHLYSNARESEQLDAPPSKTTSRAPTPEVSSPTARALLESINSRPKLKPVAQAVKDSLFGPAGSLAPRFIYLFRM